MYKIMHYNYITARNSCGYLLEAIQILGTQLVKDKWKHIRDRCQANQIINLHIHYFERDNHE